MAITKEQKSELITKFGASEKDTGKTEVQVAILSKDILLLTEHLQTNPKDHHTKRGLFKKVGTRKKLLKYLQNKHVDRYRQVIDTLGLRK
jgi:small subunit ribosomal protein S15